MAGKPIIPGNASSWEDAIGSVAIYRKRSAASLVWRHRAVEHDGEGATDADENWTSNPDERSATPPSPPPAPPPPSPPPPSPPPLHRHLLHRHPFTATSFTATSFCDFEEQIALPSSHSPWSLLTLSPLEPPGRSDDYFEEYLPPWALSGLLPACLLEEFEFWRVGHVTIRGYSRAYGVDSTQCIHVRLVSDPIGGERTPAYPTADATTQARATPKLSRQQSSKKRMSHTDSTPTLSHVHGSRLSDYNGQTSPAHHTHHPHGSRPSG